jgi:putative flippase GtrA
LLPTLSRFAVVGGLATGTYLVVSNALIFIHILPGAFSSAVAYMVAMLISYAGQSRFTFRVGNGDAQQPLRYIAMSACGIGISYLSVFAAEHVLRMAPAWGTLATAIIVPIISFLMMKFWVFTPRTRSDGFTIGRGQLLSLPAAFLIPGIEAYPESVVRKVAYCVWGAIALWMASFVFMATVPLSGDEVFYAGSAAAIARFLIHGDISLAQIASHIVGYGWFMPGVSFALLPLYIFDQTPWQPIIRLFASLATAALWGWSVREVYRAFGIWYAVAIIVFPPFALTWLFFTATIWGELAGGLFLAIATARTWSIARSSIAGTALEFRKILYLEMVLIPMVYMRGSTILIVVAIHVFLLVIGLLYGKPREIGKLSIPLVLGAAIFALALAPWSFTASKVLGGPVTTTTTPVLSFGITFGDNDKLCFGPCPGNNIWFAAANFSRKYASEHGIGQLQAQRLMAANALQGLTLKNYLAKVHGTFRTFAFTPEQFSTRFLSTSILNLSKSEIRFGEGLSKAWTRLFYFPFFIALVFANFAVFRRAEDQVASLMFKMFSLCIFLQPFDHVSHPRYWPAFAVLMGLSGGFLAQYRWSLRQERGGAAYTMNGQERFLFGIQIAYVALVGAICATVWLA